MMFLSFTAKFTKYLFYFVFVLVILVFLLAGIGLFTHSGNTLLFNSLNKLEPRLSILLTEGTIADSPTYEHIRWSDGDMLFEFNQLSYQFDWHCLMGELCLDSLTMDSANINIVLSDTPPEPVVEDSEPFVLNFPIPVHIKHLDINNTNVKVAGVEIDVKQLLLTASGSDNDLSLDSTIIGLTVVLADSNDAALAKKASNKNNVTHNNKIKPLDFPAILQDSTLPEVILPFNLLANKLDIQGFKLVQNNKNIIVVNQAKSQFTYIGSLIEIFKLQFDLPEGDLDLSGNIDLTARYPMDINALIELKELKALQPSTLLTGQRIKLHSKGDLGQLDSTIELTNVINAEVVNTIDLYSQNLPHELTVKWQEIQWPLKGGSQVTANNGLLSSHGALNDYDLSLVTNYIVNDVPNGKIDLKGTGNLSSLSLSQLLVNTLQGYLLLKGELGWIDEVNWNGALEIADINFKEISDTYPAHLSGHIKQSFNMPLNDKTKPAWSFELPLIDVHGAFLERPLSINGAISGNADKGFYVNDIKVLNANNQLTINGKVAEQNDLLINLLIEDLSKIIIDSAGSIRGDVKLSGSIDAIKINTALTANKITYLQNSVEDIKLDGDIQLAAIPVADLSVAIKNIMADKQVIDTVSIRVKPDNVNLDHVEHVINLGLQSNIITTELQVLFMQERTNWQAELNEGLIKSLQGTWLLNTPFVASAEKETINITPHCWSATTKQNENNGEICINNFSAGNDGDIEIAIDNLQLNSFAAFIPKELRLEGSLDAGVNLLWKQNNKPDIDILVDGNAVALNIKVDKVQKDFIRYPVDKLFLSLKTKEQKAKISFQAISQNLLDLQFNGFLTPYNNTPKIDAKLQLSVPNFDAFAILIPEVDNLSGYLNSQLDISGKLQKPIVKGQVLIADMAITAIGSPIQATDLNAKIDIEQNKANIEGYFFTNAKEKPVEEKRTLLNDLVTFKDTAISTVNIPQRIANMKNAPKQQQDTNGRADITGFLDWENKFKGNIQFKADQMYIQDYGKIELYISPDINFLFGETIELEGLITVDKGNITVKELPPGAVNVSKDIIVVDAEQENDVSDLPIKMNLKVALGNALRVQAIGLDSYVHGDLRIRKELLKALTMYGELTFSQGSYRALAQELVLQNSRVVFQGNPDSPYLFIEAIRDPNNVDDNVTAGVRVTGTPEQLQLTLFSDPSMSQQDVLSYITRGRSVENSAEDGTSSQLAAVLIDIGAGKTDGLMQDIGSKIGISDLSLSSSGQGDEQSVGVRGTLAPGVEISYGVGVFDSFTILALRYELFERFYIEASSGLYNAVDAYYEWDWD